MNPLCRYFGLAAVALAVPAILLGCAPGPAGTGAAGATGSAGKTGSGGTTASGGTIGSGGTTASGGTIASGGTTASGGTIGSGGTTANGGTIGSGGTTASGGATASGGRGGTTGTAGTTGTGGRGGTVGSAGTTGTGGTTGAGGGGVVGPSGLPTPPGAGGMPKPAGTPGNVTVINWAGFKAAVSYTFDDTNSSQISNYSALNGLGVPLTFYLITNKTEASNAIWAQAVKDGHEIANHTHSHTQTGTGADVDAGADFILQRLGVIVYTMAAPYGNASYISLASTRYLANRGVNNGQIAPNDNTDPFNLFCFIPATGASASAFNSEIDAVRTAGRWKTVLVHGFTGGSDGAYQPVAIGEFTASVNHTKSLGDVWIGTVVDVTAYWRAQKMFSGLTPTTSGSSRTWTWTLPAHFPPGKYLRVKVDGGTLTQGGTTLPWNDHGYYEVALDAKTLTLGP